MWCTATASRTASAVEKRRAAPAPISTPHGVVVSAASVNTASWVLSPNSARKTRANVDRATLSMGSSSMPGL
jgi:hypothetical protein